MGWVRWGVALLLLALVPATSAVARPSLIPMPVSVAWHDGGFPIAAGTVVEGQGDAASTAAYLARTLGLKRGQSGGSRIRLVIVPASVIAGQEAYRLTVRRSAVRIEASHPRGLFYGAQTLRQLVTRASSGSLTVPAVDISDAPRFRWRGLLVDVSRHFFGKPALLRIIDEMAAYKLNVLQLHLTDDPGWRIEIPAYPKLTEIGALGDATRPDSGARQYFTADDIRDIVAYAGERHITVVPEIEMPGHAGSEARAYPEFFDATGHFNPAKPETYTFIRTVLSEVARLFPGPIIHFGGDEVPDDTWKDMPDVARLKTERGLKTTDDVEAYFGDRVVQIIRDVGKRPMAWDEQVEAKAAKSVVIHWWRKGRPDVLNAAAKAGYELVLSPVDQVYFDYSQGPGEPGAPWEGNDNGPTSIAKILAWEPVPDSFTPEELARVLGVEAAVWTEFIRTERYLQFMTFPRLLAFAEVAWRPRGPRDEKEFTARLEPHTDALRAKGINARRGEGDAYEYIVN
jgi:hexosaminidase